MSHHYLKTILIICEGQSTEPSYFEAIRDLVMEKNSNVKITISPRSNDNKELPANTGTGRPRRTLKKIEQKKERELRQYEVEAQYKAQPVRYVREAQKGLEDGTFDEAWAVFDKDGHARPKEAFDLANCECNGKKVGIAFSSISFEHWVLLHFETNHNPFKKSQCKDDDGKSINCGTKNHKNDCNGTLCVCGYIATANYSINNCKGGSTLYSELKPFLSQAMKNAHKLRTIQHQTYSIPIYEMNPYTNVDQLVFTLLQSSQNFSWIGYCQEVVTPQVRIATKIKDKKYHITIENLKNATFIINQDDLVFLNAIGYSIHILTKKEILEPLSTTTVEIHLGLVQGHEPLYIAYIHNPNNYIIRDL